MVEFLFSSKMKAIPDIGLVVFGDETRFAMVRGYGESQAIFLTWVSDAAYIFLY